LAWVPNVVPNRRNRGNRPRGGIFAAVMLLIVFGFLAFFFFNNFNGFVMPIWFIISGFGVFLIIIVVITVIASSMSQVYKKPKENYFKYDQNQQQDNPYQMNPYIIRDSASKPFEESINKEIKQEIPIIPDINFCRYCGSKIDRDAVYCQQCGTKL
jgi:hypothetical protein